MTRSQTPALKLNPDIVVRTEDVLSTELPVPRQILGLKLMSNRCPDARTLFFSLAGAPTNPSRRNNPSQTCGSQTRVGSHVASAIFFLTLQKSASIMKWWC